MSPAELDRALASARPVVPAGFADAVVVQIARPEPDPLRVAAHARAALEPSIIAHRSRRLAITTITAGLAIAAAFVVVLLGAGDDRDRPRDRDEAGAPARSPLRAVAPTRPPTPPTPSGPKKLENPHDDEARYGRCSLCHELSSAAPSSRRLITPKRKVTVQAFVEFDCPSCRETIRTLEILAISHPDVRILMLHPTDDVPTRAALSADNQGRYWEMAELLVTNPDHSRSTIAAHAKKMRLGLDRFAAGFTDAKIEAEIEQERRHMLRYGITPPSFVIDGLRFDGPQALELMRRQVEEMLSPLPPPPPPPPPSPLQPPSPSSPSPSRPPSL